MQPMPTPTKGSLEPVRLLRIHGPSLQAVLRGDLARPVWQATAPEAVSGGGEAVLQKFGGNAIMHESRPWKLLD